MHFGQLKNGQSFIANGRASGVDVPVQSKNVRPTAAISEAKGLVLGKKLRPITLAKIAISREVVPLHDVPNYASEDRLIVGV